MDDVLMTFEATTERFISDQKSGEAAALKAVARVKGEGNTPHLLVTICCAIAAADGGFDAEERAAVLRICDVLDLDPAAFSIEDAR
jgi:tellurite resistance protein TerB